MFCVVLTRVISWVYAHAHLAVLHASPPAQARSEVTAHP